MSKSYRIRTQVGVDKSIKVQLDQDFEFLEILSLKILQSQIYTRPCSDYGVVIGRVSVNDGFGLPNCKVSIFIPLTDEDAVNPILSDLYPYRTLSDFNEDGYRYNLLPYKPSYSAHIPTGTFFTRDDVLTDTTLIQVFDKYFKYTAVTNESGDFMIFGVPVGTQTIHLDVDLSDIGDFSLSPQDLIRMGRATESQVAGVNFKSSPNLANLPQIVTINKTVEVEPLWGQPEVCNLGITRTDFDLSSEANILIEPTSIFMGSLFSDSDELFQKRRCRPKLKQGNLCSLQTGPGEILAIRQTILQDENGRPVLEQVDLEQGGQVIDENGAWMIDLPMNLDYVITNEFGEQVLSDDPKKGIPTKAKYRFKVKWNQPPNLSQNTKRGYFLIPNIKENGWVDSGQDPLHGGSGSYNNALASYAFSLDWNDYGDTGTTEGNQMILDAINCEDRFYPFVYNKVYTISQFIDKFRFGYLPGRILGIKHILDSECNSENNKFPTNDAFFRFDLIYFLFIILLFIIRPILVIVVVITHILAFIVGVIRGFVCLFKKNGKACRNMKEAESKFLNLKIPNVSYPNCSLCDCGELEQITDNAVNSTQNQETETQPQNDPLEQYLAPTTIESQFNTVPIFGTQLVSISTLFAGDQYDIDNQSFKTRVPQVYSFNGGGENVFTTSLTLTERINLFNSKAKYFDNDNTNNPGGGVNRIRVQFGDPVLNSGKYHTDNVVCLLINKNLTGELPSGSILTFQSPSLTQDVNVTGLNNPIPYVNQFGTTSITGTPINISTPISPSSYVSIPQPITINYSNPSPPYNQLSVTYDIQQRIDDVDIQKFSFDLEYFQVITGMTYSQFFGMCNTTTISGFSEFTLNNRFLNNTTNINILNGDVTWSGITNLNSLNSLIEYENHIVLFLVRGVDPHSSRVTASYDLSRLFGYDVYGNVVVSQTADNNDPTVGFKMNWPIQGNLRAVKHDNIVNNYSVDSYSNTNLFYNSFHFLPTYGTGFFSFSGFNSTLPFYYSSLDNSSISYQPDPSVNIINDFCNSGVGDFGLLIDNPTTKNLFLYEFTSSQSNSCGGYYSPVLNLVTNTTPCRGYFNGEQLDGISVMYFRQNNSSTFVPNSSCSNQTPDATGIYYTPIYLTSTTISFNSGTNANNNRIVMRSDRLPTSTYLSDSLNNSFAGQSNQFLDIYSLTDDGFPLQLVGGPTNTPNIDGGDTNNTGDTPSNFSENLLSTFDCGGMVPLGCYYVNNNEIDISSISPSEYEASTGLPQQASCPPCNDCYLNGANNNMVILRNGCYVLVTKPFTSLRRDLQLLIEWSSRIQIIFAACRDVWSHYFGNNWVNGSLYAFAFKNERYFDAQNQPYSVYCNRTVTLHPTTNNFYYRCTPYNFNNSAYIGQDAPSPIINIIGDFGGNTKNLKTPTTIIDLGPRSYYLQEIVMSDDYDGYIVNKLNSTSYNDVEEILNFLILSRLVNQSFIGAMLGTGQGSNVLKYFDKRNRIINRQVDGDYSQALSVSSELGVLPFTVENYPDIPNGQDYTFINSGNSKEPIMGIFFRSDLQLRDFLTPKRTIIDLTGSTIGGCSFNYFNVFSQDVPMYQWNDGTNTDYDSIFGSQGNDWYTEDNILPTAGSGNSLYHRRYQSLDRLPTGSRYFETINTSKNYFFKGYIYSVTLTAQTDTNLSADISTWNTSQIGSFPNGERPLTVGSPFFFYFGLKKGKSAWDRFARKWVGFENITED